MKVSRSKIAQARAMAYLIAERSSAHPFTEADLHRMTTRLGPCLSLRGARWLRSYLSADRRRLVCVFEALDREDVCNAHRTAGFPYDRVWAAELLLPLSEKPAS